MKNIFLLWLTLFIGTALNAQPSITSFLGIPVDGSKPDMISSLVSKGFAYDSIHDQLIGQYCGSDVYVMPVTNNGRVYRIYVQDRAICRAADIKARFNGLCRKFGQDSDYSADNQSTEIAPSVDIASQIKYHDKVFRASYYQHGDKSNPVWFMITERYGRYYISMYFDNLRNLPDDSEQI